MHPGRGGGPSIEDCFPHLSRRRDGPWLAHRLDTDTAGCLVVALRHAALIAAQGLFAAGRVEKTYWAIVQGRPAANSGRIANRIAKHSDKSGWRMVVEDAGLPARTDWRLRGTDGVVSWLELRPHTGRTHQIRVHCAALGCPILGDPIYGDPETGTLHLLAREISLPLEPQVAATAPVPDHMQAAFLRCQ